PKETLAPLTNEELAKRLTNNSGVESYRHEVERLSKRVYNKSEALKEIVEMVNIDPSLGPKFADQIAQHPKSFYKLA
ncbi:BID domain-containing T4SS effector, partial [Bartonella sp. AA86SXKL]